MDTLFFGCEELNEPQGLFVDLWVQDLLLSGFCDLVVSQLTTIYLYLEFLCVIYCLLGMNL